MMGEGGRENNSVGEIGWSCERGSLLAIDVKQCRTYGAGGFLFDFVPSAYALG